MKTDKSLAKTNKQNKITTQVKIKDLLPDLIPEFHPRSILIKAQMELDQLQKKSELKGMQEVKKENITQATTISELNSGCLLGYALPESYKTFAIELRDQLYKEFDCQTVSEQSLAEVVSLNWSRVLNIQKKLDGFTSKEAFGDLTVKIIKSLSQELDRAHRHYLTSLEALQSIKQPQLKMNIKTQTAIVGQQQMIQSNQNNKPK